MTVEAIREGDEKRFTNDAYFTIVAVDDEGRYTLIVPDIEMVILNHNINSGFLFH